jgi:peroxiredoxin Q/BCP
MPTTAHPRVGEPAPDFTAETDAGEPLTLSSLRGRPVVLYFYPRDDTDGCTAEACGFRDLFPRFAAADAVVLGVSPDSAASHARFKRRYALPFTLVADADHRVAEAYGVWKEKRMFGRRYMGVERTTFLVDRGGRVARVFEKVRPAGHAEAVAAAVAELG